MNRPDLDHVDWTHHVLVDKYEDLISSYLNKGKCDFWTEQKTDVLVSLQLSITPFDFYLRSVHLHLDEISHLTGRSHLMLQMVCFSQIHLERNNYKLFEEKKKSQALSRNTLQMTGWFIRLLSPVTRRLVRPGDWSPRCLVFRLKWLIIV